MGNSSSGSRPRITDDFGSDDAAQPSGPDLEPTRTSGVAAGLEEVNEAGETLFHAIVTQDFSIGREPENNLVVRDDTKVSRRHAVITREGMHYILRDNNSSNGTFVNGQRITEHSLKVDDVVGVGKREYKFILRAS